VLPLHTKVLFLKKIKISIFGDISKLLKLIVFGQFWADFAVMTTCPHLKGKK
jgi:hypothetical protein